MGVVKDVWRLYHMRPQTVDTGSILTLISVYYLFCYWTVCIVLGRDAQSWMSVFCNSSKCLFKDSKNAWGKAEQQCLFSQIISLSHEAVHRPCSRQFNGGTAFFFMHQCPEKTLVFSRTGDASARLWSKVPLRVMTHSSYVKTSSQWGLWVILSHDFEEEMLLLSDLSVNGRANCHLVKFVLWKRNIKLNGYTKKNMFDF